MSETTHIRLYEPGSEPDRRAAYHVCFKTGNHGDDGEPLFREDPDALGRIFVGPYLEFAPELSFLLEDAAGVCGYTLGVVDSRAFYQWFEREWRPRVCERFPDPEGDPETWTPLQNAYHLYHEFDCFCPDPYAVYPAHLHIDLLPRAQGRGYGRRMTERLMTELAALGAPGVHLGVSALNERAYGFYRQLGFEELTRRGGGAEGVIYMGKKLGGG